MCVCVCVCACMLSCFSCVQPFVTLRIVAYWAPLFLGFSGQEYWGVAMPSPKGSSRPRDQTPMSLMSPALAGEFFTTSPTWEAHIYMYIYVNSALVEDT